MEEEALAGPYYLTGEDDSVQMVRNSATLSITPGVARYNGKEVLPGWFISGDVPPEETILESELPVWAAEKVRATASGDFVQMSLHKATLQISPTGSFYNGKHIERTTS